MLAPNHRLRPGASLVELYMALAIVAVLLTLSAQLIVIGINFAHQIESKANWAKKRLTRRSIALASQPVRATMIPYQYIVILHDGADRQQAISRLSAYVPLRIVGAYSRVFNGFTVQTPASSLQSLMQDPAVRYVEQDQTLLLARLAEGEGVSTGVRRINAWTADMPVQTVDADIAVIDTGADLATRDLSVVVRKGFGFAEDAKDTDGHGTQVAGVAAARMNGRGVVGVAPGARVWALKVAAENDSGAASNLVAALDYVMEHAGEIEVANISVLTAKRSQAVNLAAARCVQAGVAVVAAAGNGGRDAATVSPASEPGVISVAALADTDGNLGGKGDTTYTGDADDTLASFSNYGSVIDFLAPGVQIEVLDLDEQRVKVNGTSYAAAHVSGLAALASHRLSRSLTTNRTSLSSVLAALATERIPGRGRHDPYPVVSAGTPQREAPARSITAATQQAQSVQLPISFEPNLGQAHPNTRFIARTIGYTTFLTPQGMVLTHNRMPAQRITFANASANPATLGRKRLPGVANYFIGNDPSRWRTDIPTYEEVLYDEVYPGIDVLFQTDDFRLRYDFIVAPGADPSQITLEFPDAIAVTATRDGRLRIQLTAGVPDLEQGAPLLFQRGAYGMELVRGRYVVVGAKQVRFDIGDYDRSRELIIDPILFSTLIGGSGSEIVHSMAMDSAGNIYLGGGTNSTNFPTVGPFDSTLNGSDVYVMKVNPTGTAIVYSTYIGGAGNDGPTFGGLGISVSNAGEVAITSETGSNDFPLMNAFQTSRVFFDDNFVTKLNAAGNGLVFSTYLGGGGFERAYATAFDSTGAVYALGNSTSGDFPTTPGAFQTTNKGGGLDGDIYVTKFGPTGSLDYSTLLGSSAADVAENIVVFGSDAIIVGVSGGTNFPTTPGAFQTTFGGGQHDIVVARLNATGTGLVYSTYLGGTGADGRFTFPFGAPMGLTVDAAGNAYIAGGTNSPNYPTTPGVVQTAIAGSSDALITKLNATGSALIFSTLLGGGNVDIAYAIDLDAAGNIYVTGDTSSADFPVVNPVMSYRVPFTNCMVAVLNPTATNLIFSTPVGSGGITDSGRGVAPDATGNVWFAGSAGGGFPEVAPIITPTPSGSNGFLAKIAPSFAGVTVTQSGGTTAVTEGGAGDSYTIVLNTPPSANVSIQFNGGGQLTVPTSIIFTPSNWNTPQTVAVAAFDDNNDEGPHTGTIVHTVVSTDPVYSGFVVASITVSITDNDAGVINVPNRRDLVFDATRNVLYVTTTAGTVARYDVTNRTLLSPWTVGNSLNGADITPDDAFLFVAEDSLPNATQGTFKKVNLTNGSTTDIMYTLQFGESSAWDIAVGCDGKAVCDTKYAGSGWVPVRVLDIAASSFTVLPQQVRQNTHIHRSVERHSMLFAESNISSGPILIYDPFTQKFPVTVNTNSSNTNNLSAVNRDGSLFAHEIGAALSIRDRTLTQITSLTGVDGGMVFDPVRNLLYAVNPTTDQIVALNTNTWATAFTIPVNENIPTSTPFGSGVMTITPTGSKLFLSTGTVVRMYDLSGPGMLINETGGCTHVFEGGATDTYTISLITQPTANVTVTIAPDSQLTVSPTTLVFTPANWSTPQTVTVTAVDDPNVEGPHPGTISNTAASADAGYAGMNLGILAEITDNDFVIPAVNITQSGGSTAVAEGGATDTYTVVLNSQPTASVTVNMNAGTQLSTAPTSLTFTATNWDTPQTVTVTAVDDFAVEGAHSGTITHTAVSADTAYSGITIPSITASITDNDTAITQSLYGVTWGGQPQSLVKIDPLTGAGTVVGPVMRLAAASASAAASCTYLTRAPRKASWRSIRVLERRSRRST